MPVRPACAAVIALAVLGACASQTSGPSRSSVVVSRPAATIAPTTPVTTAAADPTSTTRPALDVVRWTDDMQALGAGIRRIHPNPFWRQSETEFDASLVAAPSYLATLGDSDARAAVMRLTAKIDGHSGVYLAEAGFHLYAVHLYAFGDDIDIVAASDPALFGAKVLSIDGMPIAAAVRAVAPYSPYDNPSTIELVVPTLLATPEVLHAAGVIDDVNAPHYIVRLVDGTERAIDPEQLSWAEFASRIDPRPIGMTKIVSMPALARVDEPFWTTVLDGASTGGAQTMYLQYNEVVRQSGSRSIDQLADDIDTTLSSGSVTRLVVDLRYNPGGNDLTYPALLHVVTTHQALSRPGSLVVLIGRQTFSAAVLFATELDKQTNAVFIGEPTGGSPNVYANPRPLKLPNSGIVVEVSSKYFEVGGAADHRDAIVPDIAATSNLDDLLTGRDPVNELTDRGVGLLERLHGFLPPATAAGTSQKVLTSHRGA